MEKGPVRLVLYRRQKIDEKQIRTESFESSDAISSLQQALLYLPIVMKNYIEPKKR
jgi:hypothetical protein